MSNRRAERPLGDVVRVMGKLGLTAFGGPAAHIAMLEDEVVDKRRWVSRQHFLDLVGATNLIPGPNSTEMMMHLGYARAGGLGLIIGGAAFLLPAVAITAALAWIYVEYGTLPQVEPFLVGIKPAVVAVILAAVSRLGRKAVRNVPLALLGISVTAAVLLGINEIVTLAGGAVVGTAALRFDAWRSRVFSIGPLVSGGFLEPIADVSLTQLGWVFLKVGAILYGSGYVLIAFLEGDLVGRLEWLTQAQLLDAIAVGQFTPGPVLSTATFVGYVVAGLPGAVVATAGIFLPSFAFVRVLNPLVPKLRRSPTTSAFLDAVNVSALGLMVAVTIELGLSALAQPAALGIALASAVAVIGFRVNTTWVVLGGAMAGYALTRVGLL
ncbi:MAG: chromate efflux transporter [Candidatus Bipolaricaulia bacterium]